MFPWEALARADKKERVLLGDIVDISKPRAPNPYWIIEIIARLGVIYALYNILATCIPLLRFCTEGFRFSKIKNDIVENERRTDKISII